MNLLIVQSGGPTAVWNATLHGILKAARRVLPGTAAAAAHRPRGGAGQAGDGSASGRIYGALGGLAGALEGRIADLTDWPDDRLEALSLTPGGVLGSARYKVQPGDMEKLLDRCEELEIDIFLFVGGNGSMMTPLALHRISREKGRTRPAVIGVPKTVDNDLHGTDFAPGFPSAARFIARATMDGTADLATMTGFDAVKVLEVMGRNAGWLAAAAALAPVAPGTAPPIILLPEVPLNEERFLQSVTDTFARYGHAYVVASEGVREPDGTLLATKSGPVVSDPLGRPVFGARNGAGSYLSELVSQRLGLPTRFDKPGTITRGALTRTPADVEQATRLGEAAVEAGLQGASGVMVGLKRTAPLPGVPAGYPYEADIALVDLADVAGRERLLPAHFLAPDGTLDSGKFQEYAGPLVGPLPEYAPFPGRNTL